MARQPDHVERRRRTHADEIPRRVIVLDRSVLASDRAIGGRDLAGRYRAVYRCTGGRLVDGYCGIGAFVF